MVDFAPVMARKTFRTRLRPEDKETVEFSPEMGRIAAFAVNTERKKPTHEEQNEAEPEFDPEDLLKQESVVEVSLFPPGASEPIRTALIKNPDPVAQTPKMTFSVGGGGPSGTWQCFFKNVGTRTHVFVGFVDFVEDIVKVRETPIPLRVLNHGLRQVIDALAIKMIFNGSRSRIEFSEDLEKVLGFSIAPVRFDAGRLSGFGLKTLEVRAVRAVSGRPAISVRVEAQPGEVEIPGPNVEVRELKFVLTLEMSARGEPHERTIDLTPALDVSIDINNLPDFQSQIRNAALDAIKDRTGPLRQIGAYLTTAFAKLAGREEEFFDITAPNTRRFIVSHFNPAANAGDTGGVINPVGGVDPADEGFPNIKPKERDSQALAKLRNNIDHIVVLMQENRSFDHMLGYLRLLGGRDEVDGLTGDESNVDLPEIENPVRPRRLESTTFANSPSHDLNPILEQVARGEMSGFVRSYRKAYPDVPFEDIMGFYTGDQLRTFDFLARNYMVCNRWFSSYPGATQPNRFCLYGGQTPTQENFDVEDDMIGYVREDTLFDVLTKHGIEWRVFERDIAFLRFYDRYRLDDEHIVPFDDPQDGFEARAKSARGLPAVSFIDPDYVQIPPIAEASDDHPPADVTRGQELVAAIHDILTASPGWTRTLFVITYDEHGGFYDHVPPPGTPASPMVVVPVHRNGPRHYGVRVPGLIVSPWIDERSVSDVIFDHTSVATTILLRFVGDDLRVGLGRRVTQANDFSVALARNAPRNERAKLGAVVPKISRGPRVGKRTVGTTKDFHEVVRTLGRPRRVAFQKLI